MAKYKIKDGVGIIPEGTTCIEDKAFEGCTNLQSVIIPTSVTAIEANAFNGCNSLTAINIPESVTSIGSEAFKDCTRLTKVVIPNGVTHIGYQAFDGCSCLTSVIIPNGIKSIGGIMYFDTDYEGKLTGYYQIKYGEFSNCTALSNVEIPNSVKYITAYAFPNCPSLKSIVIPNSVRSIGQSAFRGCPNLESISIPDSVTSIGCGAFHDTLWFKKQTDGIIYINKVLYTYKGEMPQNTAIVIKDGILNISGYAFSRRTNLVSVVIPEGVTYIGERAFYNCENLVSVEFPNSVKTIGCREFDGCAACKYEGLTFAACPKLKDVKISEGVVNIGFRAFKDCTGLEYIKLPKTIRNIDMGAFEGCTSLKSICIPEGVEEISFSAFANCAALEKVVLPRSLKNLKKSAFKGCTAIKEIVVPTENEKYIMKQLPKELQALVRVTTKTLVGTTPEPVIELVTPSAATSKVIKESAPVAVDEVVASAPVVEDPLAPTHESTLTPTEKHTPAPVEFYDVYVKSTGWSSSNPIGVVRNVLGGDLDKAKELLNNIPCIAKKGLSKKKAESFKATLKQAGFKVELLNPEKDYSRGTFDVVLKEVGENKKEVIRTIMKVCRIGSSEVENLVARIPCVVASLVPNEAKTFKKTLERIGAKVALLDENKKQICTTSIVAGIVAKLIYKIVMRIKYRR